MSSALALEGDPHIVVIDNGSRDTTHTILIDALARAGNPKKARVVRHPQSRPRAKILDAELARIQDDVVIVMDGPLEFEDRGGVVALEAALKAHPRVVAIAAREQLHSARSWSFGDRMIAVSSGRIEEAMPPPDRSLIPMISLDSRVIAYRASSLREEMGLVGEFCFAPKILYRSLRYSLTLPFIYATQFFYDWGGEAGLLEERGERKRRGILAVLLMASFFFPLFPLWPSVWLGSAFFHFGIARRHFSIVPFYGTREWVIWIMFQPLFDIAFFAGVLNRVFNPSPPEPKPRRWLAPSFRLRYSPRVDT